MATILELTPNIGLPPLRFGMSSSEASVALETWGDAEPLTGLPGEPEKLRLRDEPEGFDLFALFEFGEGVSAIEIWRPRTRNTWVVRALGLDVFAGRASAVLQSLADQGVEVTDAELQHPTCPQVALGFRRNSQRDIFDSVLIAPPGYYSREADPVVIGGMYLPRR